MDSKKRRSTLRKSLSSDVDNMKTQLKRRISFSGKNSVRVFHGEEEPKTWNNSYEISDHLNGNETASNLGAAPENKTPRSALKNKHNNKENLGQCNTTQEELQVENNYQQKNASISNNQSVLSTTKELINISYQNQNSKMYHIDNSVDITLYEREIHFQNEQNKTCEQTTNNLCSFSLDDNEKETRSIIFGERTVDFMRELRCNSSNIKEDDTKINDFKDERCVSVFSEYMEEDQYNDFTSTKGKSSKEPITIYMNDSLSISSNEEIANSNKRTIQQATAMNLSPKMVKQYDKENINPRSLPNVNETQNETYDMEINDEFNLPSQSNDVNVQKETLAFQEKLNRLSFLQESDDIMNIDNSLYTNIKEPNTKARSTINFNETIEKSPKDALVKHKINFRSTINCNQPIEISPKSKNERSEIIMPIKKADIQKSFNFNKTIEFSPKNVDVKSGDYFFPKNKSEQNLNFNQSMEIDTENARFSECSNQLGTISKIKSRATINFHQPIEISPPNIKINLPRPTINLNDDISDSPVKLSQEPVSNNNLNGPGSIRKPGQLPKLVVRKICTPLVNKNKNPIDLEQQRMQRYKKKQEQNVASGNVKNKAIGIETGVPSNPDKSLNFSLSSVKNLSLSSESSSPLVPSEFKALNFKQLNDELERGKINVFANAPKTPSTDRKNRNTASNFSSKASSQPLTKERRTLVFDDVNIPISSDDTLNKEPISPKSNNYFDFNSTPGAIVQKMENNAKCRYSQADDVMLDNTSFLTRAKLSDETVCRSTSKREITQLNDIMNLFDESLRDAASKLDRGLSGSCVKTKKSCNKNDTLSSMFKNAKPIFTQAITNIKDCNNYIDAYDIMDISTENCSKLKKYDNNKSSLPHSRQTILLNQNIEPCEVYTSNNVTNRDPNKNNEASICANTEMEIDDQYGNDSENRQQKFVGKITIKSISHNNDIEKKEEGNTSQKIVNPVENQSIHKEEDIEIENAETVNNNLKPTRKTLHFYNDLCELDESIAKQQFNKISTNIVDTETSNKNEAYLNTKQIQNLVEKCARQTIYLNNDIEESFISEAKENIHEEKSIKSTTVNDDCIENLKDGNLMNFKDKIINTNCTDIISSKKQTLYPNDIGEEIISQPEKKSKNNQILCEEIKKPRRNTIYFDNDSIIDDNQEIYKKREIFGIDKNGLNLMPNREINFEETIENSEQSLAPIQIEKNIETYNSKSMRKTLYFNNKIPEEIDAIRTKNNTELNDSDTDVFNSKVLTKSLYFNNDIQSEKSIQNMEAEKVNTAILKTKPLRKTAYFHSEITSEKELIEYQKHCESEKCKTDICESNTTRKTLYFDHKIPIENYPIEAEKPAIISCISNPTRTTMHFDNEVCELDESKSQKTDQQFCNRVSQSRKSIHIAQDMDVTLSEVISKVEDKPDSPFLNSGKLFDKTNSNNDNNKTGVVPGRKSIYTAECMVLSFDGEEQENNEIVGQPKLPTTVNCMMDLTLDVEQQIKNTSDFLKDNEGKDFKESDELCAFENNEPKKDKRKTLYFEDNNEISIDQSFTPAENYQFPEPEKPLNVAKMRFGRHTKTNSINGKSKLTNTQENAPMTPKNFTSNHRLFHMTPRLSLLEFTAAEKKAREEERLQNMKLNSPLRSEVTNKRLPLNLTPVLSIPKKRQTLVFDDCLIDESNTSPQAEKSIEKLVSPKVLDYDMEITKDQEQFSQSKRGTYDQAMEISGIVANDTVLHTPSPKQRKSCIPIPISSGKKSNKSMVETSFDNHREAGDQFDNEGDNLVESIQFLRRATTFTQRRDTTIRPIDLNIENEPAGKASIFEGNPITISDVSVFFEAQRKSNSLVPETEINLDVEQIDVSGLKAIERAKKSLENHHLNLTLEDIQKTRLSLVQISYEEQEDNFAEDTSPPSNDVINEDVDDILGRKSKRQSANYLRNISAVCRKCKRCQETVLNETTSSTYDSFVLPPLPPLPDLGLDRLRRLRKRPIISDVNIIWQRVSLDRTIINPFNISDDESQIIFDLDDEAEDDRNAVKKCIRSYKNDMLCLENDLLGKQENKAFREERQLVLRLKALLSANSSNWIFDFQMQSRGILLFTHKKLFTFVVSLKFDEIDSFGKEISVKSVKLEKSHVLEKDWKAIDFVLDFQLKLNLPFDLQSLCEGNSEADIFKMLQSIDRVCLDTIKMGHLLQRITFTNQATIIRDELRTYVRKTIRKIIKRIDSDCSCVEKTEIKVELLNLKKLSFKNIFSPSLHNFCEEIHLLPTGLKFLEEFLPNPLNFINHH